MNTFANALVCLVLLLSALTVSVAESQQGTIIYESKTITQKKGQSLTKVLKKAQLSDYQVRLIRSSAIYPEALSDRSFRLMYEVSGGKKLLREVRVTRDKKQVNFLVKGGAGKHHLVKGKSQVRSKKVPNNIKLSSLETNNKPPVKLTSMTEPAYAVSFIQQRGKQLDKAWRVVKLTAYQQKILKDGNYAKEALSDRHFTLYFDKKDPQTRKLLGMIIVRGKSRVEYMVERAAGGHTLTSLKRVSAKKRAETLNRFAKADHTYLKKQTKKVATKQSPTKQSPTQKKAVSKKTPPKAPSKKTVVKKPTTKKTVTKKTTKSVRHNGRYTIVRMRQKKGQSISTAMRSVRLSGAQKKLISQIPVTKSAKSTRYFNLLFERNGKNKYLKAVRVTRAGKSADFVLFKYKGKWTWANSRGQISVSGNSSFKRIPLNYRRISSHFNLRRRHPITRRIRPHKGVDLAARHGTPIYAPYNGVVRFAGRQRGYGIILEIDHQNGYRTKYAHLSRIARGLRPGKRIRKGQLIAKVGNTGLSSGAHLHYEVLVNGRARNPLTVKLPGTRGGGRKTLTAAKQQVNKYLPILRKMAK